jgi:hypothetical protein
MAIYDVYRGGAFTFDRAYRRDSLHYKLVYYLIIRQGYRHIATCEAESKKDAIRKVESGNYGSEPVPYEPFALSVLFPKKEKVAAIEYAKVMQADRKKMEAQIRGFILFHYDEFSEFIRQQTVIFSYLIEWISLQLSNAQKTDIQLLMIEFTRLTNVFKSNDLKAELNSTKELQTAIRRINSSNTMAQTTNQAELAMYLVLEYFEQTNMEDLIRSEGTKDLIELVSNQISSCIARNNHFLSNFKVIR